MCTKESLDVSCFAWYKGIQDIQNIQKGNVQNNQNI